MSNQHMDENVASALSTSVGESLKVAKPSSPFDDEEPESLLELDSKWPSHTSQRVAVHSDPPSSTVFASGNISELVSTFVGDTDIIRHVVHRDPEGEFLREMSNATFGAAVHDEGDQFDFMDDEVEVPEERGKAQAVICDRDLARMAGRYDHPERARAANGETDDEDDSEIGDEYEVPNEERPAQQCGSGWVSKTPATVPDRLMTRNFIQRELSPDVVDRIGEICVIRKDGPDASSSSPKRGRSAKKRLDHRANTMPQVILKHCIMKGGMDSPVYRIESIDIENAARDLERLKREFLEDRDLRRPRPSYDQAHVNVTLAGAAALEDFGDLGHECPLAPIGCSMTKFSCERAK